MFTMLTQHTHWWVNEMSLPAYQTIVTSGLYRRADWLFPSCTLRHVLISRSRGNRFCVFSGVLVNELLHSILELSTCCWMHCSETRVLLPDDNKRTCHGHIWVKWSFNLAHSLFTCASLFTVLRQLSLNGWLGSIRFCIIPLVFPDTFNVSHFCT